MEKGDNEMYPSFTSPTSAVSEEETRILTDYMHQQNLFKLINLYEPHRKTLTLKKFYKLKRNQQVVVSSRIERDLRFITEGKVAAIGRDFVMLTDMKRRIWIPYTMIESTNIPFGFPSYSSPHQNHIYDNQLQRKLTLKFGETVSKKEALVQQFFEESLRTNLLSWEGIWVEVTTQTEKRFGKILRTTKKELTLQRFRKEVGIPLDEIRYVSTIQLFALWKSILKKKFGG